MFFFMCVVTFVQIRLQQQRDSLKFPKKFAITYKVEGNRVKKAESTKLNVIKERILYGSPNSKIFNNTIKVVKGVVVDCFLKIEGPATTFHTVSLKTEGSALVTSTTMTNTMGVGHVYLKHTFFYLNPTFFITHTFDDHISGDTIGDSSTTGFVEIRNLPIILDKEIGLEWVKL